MRADPAHVAASRDGLVLFDQRRFDLGRAEAHELAGTIQPLLKPHGLRLEVPGPRRWYMRASGAEDDAPGRRRRAGYSALYAGRR